MIFRNYHVDNGRFSENDFIKSVNTQKPKKNCIQRPLTKQNSVEEDQGPPRAITKTYTALKINMELRNRSEHVNLCTTKRKQNKEQLA